MHGMVPINGLDLTLSDLVAVARQGASARLTDDARARMEASWDWVRAASAGDQVVYGVTTGFGSLARVAIPAEQRARLSVNLLRSHAAGVGPELPVPVVRAMMLLRANTLARGASGCRPLLVDTLLTMLERGVTPRVPSQGSCGSSGDLAPLAHLGMVLARDIADGEARFGGELLPAPEAMARAGIERIELFGKDGLALTNGAQLTTAIGALACYDADRLIQAAEVAAAMSIEALKGATRAFHPAVHALRPHPGAQDTAANLRTLLCGSALVDSVPGKVQDAYSLRCTPQVLGACRDAAAYAQRVVEIELNAVTDNPLILLSAGVTDEGFADDPLNRAYSAGHFHGEPVGMALDVLKIALCEVGSLSERRLYRLTTGNLSQRLPPALVRADRPEIGMLLPQTAAAALVSENKALAWPASVDSIPTCEDQEDHVAMSTTAARRCAVVLDNLRRIVAIELWSAAHALSFRREEQPGLRLGAGTAAALACVEGAIAHLGADAVPADHIAAVESLLRDDGLLGALPVLRPLGGRPPEGR
jgi:histidine ammonia-lyase